MKRAYVVSAWLCAGLVMAVIGDGCAFNPFNPEELPPPNMTTGSSSSGNGGTGGTGGMMGCVCPDDGDQCTNDNVGMPCPDGDEAKCHSVALSQGCMQQDGTAGFCDASGMCIPCLECTDAGCMGRCEGLVCTANDECRSGHCVDGYCCNDACDGPCNACDRIVGQCQNLPAGMVGECGTGQVCGNNFMCKPTALALLGSTCSVSSNCETGNCYAQTCRSSNGQPCVDSLECTSGLCDQMSHTCVACAVEGDCAPGAKCLFAIGTCQALPGQPGQFANDCGGGSKPADGVMCTLPVGSKCTDHGQCDFRHCVGAPDGVCAAGCNADGQCPAGATCDEPSSKCRLLPGSYCITDAQCQGPLETGICSGFPRKCQPY